MKKIITIGTFLGAAFVFCADKMPYENDQKQCLIAAYQSEDQTKVIARINFKNRDNEDINLTGIVDFLGKMQNDISYEHKQYATIAVLKELVSHICDNTNNYPKEIKINDIYTEANKLYSQQESYNKSRFLIEDHFDQSCNLIQKMKYDIGSLLAHLRAMQQDKIPLSGEVLCRKNNSTNELAAFSLSTSDDCSAWIIDYAKNEDVLRIKAGMLTTGHYKESITDDLINTWKQHKNSTICASFCKADMQVKLENKASKLYALCVDPNNFTYQELVVMHQGNEK